MIRPLNRNNSISKANLSEEEKPRSMTCPHCQNGTHRVTHTYAYDPESQSIARRRVCKKCKGVFHTEETISRKIYRD